MNYYNEFDPKCAAWLRALIEDGLIPKGYVDERSITDVRAADLAGFTQCHFFAGIGGWSFALHLAGWPSDRPVWTGSCPCQPFSVAGKRKGEADERHLWPAFRELIRAHKPPVVFGEQVASKDGRLWLAGVFADLEGMAYQRAGADLCSAGIGAPNIRQRLYWVAESSGARQDETWRRHNGARRPEFGPKYDGTDGGVGVATIDGCEVRAQLHGEHNREGLGEGCDNSRIGNSSGQRCGEAGKCCGLPEERAGDAGEHERLEHAAGDGRQQRRPEPSERSVECGCGNGVGLADTDDSRSQGWNGKVVREGEGQRAVGPGLPHRFWGDTIWWKCSDGKQRRVPCSQSLLQCVAHGIPEGMDGLLPEDAFPLAESFKGRAALLKGYGNAINVQLAAEFIKTVMELSNT